VAAITHTPHTTKSPRSGRDTSTSSLSARTLPCPFAHRPVGAYRYSFRRFHPARTIAIAFPYAVAQTFVPLNGPTSFPRNGPRRPTEVASDNLSSRLGFAVQLRARAQGDGGSPYAVLALYLQNGVLRQSGPCPADGFEGPDPTLHLESRIGLLSISTSSECCAER
jgi:hypothetical protein